MIRQLLALAASMLTKHPGLDCYRFRCVIVYFGVLLSLTVIVSKQYHLPPFDHYYFHLRSLHLLQCLDHILLPTRKQGRRQLPLKRKLLA